MTNHWLQGWRKAGIAVGCFYVPTMLLAAAICWFDLADIVVFFCAGYAGSALADKYLSREKEE